MGSNEECAIKNFGQIFLKHREWQYERRVVIQRLFQAIRF